MSCVTDPLIDLSFFSISSFGLEILILSHKKLKKTKPPPISGTLNDKGLLHIIVNSPHPLRIRSAPSPEIGGRLLVYGIISSSDQFASSGNYVCSEARAFPDLGAGGRGRAQWAMKAGEVAVNRRAPRTTVRGATMVNCGTVTRRRRVG